MQVCIKLVDQLHLECILMKCFWSECGLISAANRIKEECILLRVVFYLCVNY